MTENAFEKLRQARVLKKVTLKDLAKTADLSYSYISQIERGEASPSLASLDRLAKALDMDVWELLKDEPGTVGLAGQNAKRALSPEAKPDATRHGSGGELVSKKPKKTKLVRSDMRRSIILPQSTVQYQMITPDLNTKLQVILVKADVGSSSGEAPFEHEGEECCLMLEGEVEMAVGKEIFNLASGDSIYFASDQPHSWRNTGDVPISMLLVVTPPAY